jgi:type II secretory pathway pseudopilin PulG
MREGRALTIVEVLVALALFGVHAAALVAALVLSLSLVAAAGELLRGLESGDAAAACALLVGRPLRRQRAGLTLVETLLALAVALLTLTALAALVRMHVLTSGTLEDRAESAYAQHGLRLAVEGEVATAGAWLGEGECGVARRDAGHALEFARRGGDGSLTLITLAAGRDALALPALYRRLHPHPRQPWIEDVTSFSVVALEPVPGAPQRVAAVHLDLRHARAGAVRWRVPLPHEPCLVPGGG